MNMPCNVKWICHAMWNEWARLKSLKCLCKICISIVSGSNSFVGFLVLLVHIIDVILVLLVHIIDAKSFLAHAQNEVAKSNFKSGHKILISYLAKMYIQSLVSIILQRLKFILNLQNQCICAKFRRWRWKVGTHESWADLYFGYVFILVMWILVCLLENMLVDSACIHVVAWWTLVTKGQTWSGERCRVVNRYIK
jgi:hypothetical protein